MPLNSGVRLGPYEILASIGAGGMGEVYKARDTRLDRIVAVKVSDTVVTTNTTTADPSGNPNFNADNLEAASGEFWGVMGLTLNPNGYAWNFQSALKDPAQTTGPATYSDEGVGTCHGGKF